MVVAQEEELATTAVVAAAAARKVAGEVELPTVPKKTGPLIQNLK